MYFFSDNSLNITASTVVGSWNVAGYQQINLQAWAQGAPGSLQLNCYFNNLVAYSEKLIIGPGLNSAWLTRTLPIHSPNMSVVLSNPTTQLACKLRLYAACCEQRAGILRWLLPVKPFYEGDADRKLNQPIDLETLAEVSSPSDRNLPA